MKTECITLLLALACSTLAPAAKTLEHAYRTAGPSVHAAFDETREFLQTSSAVFKRGRKEVVFGTVVSPDGYILTKASELGSIDDLEVTVDRERYSRPQLIAEDPAWDVALVKIDAMNLVPVSCLRGEEPALGTWVVANGATTRTVRRVQVGVVAAKTREVAVKGGTVLGVTLDDDQEVLRVKEITEGSGAEAAGLMAGDVILSLDGVEIEERLQVLEVLGEKKVGDTIPVEIDRDGEKLELEVELSGRAELMGEQKTRNDMMSGLYSERRSGFPRVMQHDIQASKHFMGGPVFTLDGECVGMNIARFSRCETYAIPARELEGLVAEMIPTEE